MKARVYIWIYTRSNRYRCISTRWPEKQTKSFTPLQLHRGSSRANRFQLVVQGGVFGSLFLMMFETYPFRVGLMGMLTKQYLTVYAINVIYFFMTASVYGYRVVRIITRTIRNCFDDSQQEVAIKPDASTQLSTVSSSMNEHPIGRTHS